MHLARRAPATDLLSVVDDMSGAQAQLPSAAYISLWARLRDLQITHIEDAMRTRSLVKAACLRRTLFLVPAVQLAVFVRGTTQRAEKEIRWMRAKGVPERILEAALEATLGVLYEPLTRPEIAERVCRVLGVQLQTIHAGGWGSRGDVAAVPVGEIVCPVVYLLHLAAARGVVCYGPNRANEPTFVRADAWIPGWQDAPVEHAEDLLLRKYLRAYGPATAADFAMWTGATLTGARKIWAREQANLVSVDVEGWEAAILREDLDELAQSKFEKPAVRLLPYFDTFLLGHKERNHLMAEEHLPKVYRPQGWIAPVILVNGRVGGVWGHQIKSGCLQVKMQAFTPLPAHILASVHKEAISLGGFLGTPRIDFQMD
jgi:hypothetical protein